MTSSGDRAKRALDIIVAAVGLLMGAPLLVLVTVAVRIALGGPVFFRQQRPGVGGKPFELIKFRTMRDATDRMGNPLPDSVRLTSFGKTLRASSLDELPELWNVLRGDMSLVGPRPLLMEYLPRYSARQARRHEVRPGITGWAQVNGRNMLAWPERFESDVWYVDNRSLRLDLKILLLTLRKVVRPEGVTQAGHATMSPFAGNGPAALTGDRAA